eukprot:g18911.t1
MDVTVVAVTRHEDREVQEREGGIRDGLGEFEVDVKGVSKVDELFKLLMVARGSADSVIDVAEEELMGDNVSVAAEEGLFHISYEEACIAWVYAGAHGHHLVCRKWEELKETLFR